MHPECYTAIEDVAKRFVKDGESVADVGSYDENGNVRAIFDRCKYTGIDVRPGPNVDVVFDHGFGGDWYHYGVSKYDVVLSASVIEHVHDPFAFMRGCATVSKRLVIIVTPTTIAEHRYPIDCWRIMRDGMLYLFGRCGIKPLECRYIGGRHNDLIAVGEISTNIIDTQE